MGWPRRIRHLLPGCGILAEPVAIYARPDKKESLELVREVFRRLKKLGAEPLCDISIANLLGYPDIDLRFSRINKIVVIGGDGTLLRLLQNIDYTPILHLIRLGRRAFLFDDSLEESLNHLSDFVNDRYYVEKFMRLIIETTWGKDIALNEAAILILGSKTMDLYVEIEGETLYDNLEGDGLIIATPVGSTAYSYSSHGSIIHPGLDAYIITPVNPIDKRLSPVVVPGYFRTRVLIKRTSRPVKLIIDGVVERILTQGVTIVATLRGPTVNIARYNKRWLRLPWRRKQYTY